MQAAISILDLELSSLALYPARGTHWRADPDFEMYRIRRMHVRAARDALARTMPSSLRGAICVLLSVFHDAGCAPASARAARRLDASLRKVARFEEFVSSRRDDPQQRPWFEVCSALLGLLNGGELELAPASPSELYVWRRPRYPMGSYERLARVQPDWERFEASLIKGAASLLSYRQWIGPWSLDLPDPPPGPPRPVGPGNRLATEGHRGQGIVDEAPGQAGGLGPFERRRFPRDLEGGVGLTGVFPG